RPALVFTRRRDRAAERPAARGAERAGRPCRAPAAARRRAGLTESDRRRDSLVRTAMLVCGASVAWALGAGTAAIFAGLGAGSLALAAFGIEAVIDGAASATLVWRFAAERRRSARPERVERTAARIVGAVMLLVAVYIVAEAVHALATASGPSRTGVGIALAA